MSSRLLRIVLLGALAGAGLAGQIRPDGKAASDTYIPDPNSVVFDISVPQSPQPQPAERFPAFVATYVKGGKVAKFRIEFTPASTGDGAFVAEPGSNNSILLADLKKALEAKHMPSRIKRVDRLPFTYVLLGSHQSQTEGGGFTGKPPGNWACLKIFFPAGGDESEVFFNVNVYLAKAQFAEKDVDYGDDVLARLATVL